MNWEWLKRMFHRRGVQRAVEAEREQRDAAAFQQISDLQRRKAVVEGHLVPRQRRNHWQEAIAGMIHSGRQ